MFQRVLVSGGAGFIGSALVRTLVRDEYVNVINVDALTYAGDLCALDLLENTGTNTITIAHQKPQATHHHYLIDICDAHALKKLFLKEQPDTVIHLAAETHVDRSIDEPTQCIHTNVVGTLNMLEAARSYWQTLPQAQQKSFRFLHVSTDEVYGDIALNAPASLERDVYAPSSPYAASKAGADHLVRAWHKTYGLPVLLTHCCNNYGAYQYPEKLIPHIILNALAGKPLPIYGDGLQQRQWLFVDDHARTLWQVLQKGHVGGTYHIGAENSVSNIDLVNMLCRILEERLPSSQTGAAPYASLITHVADRPGHDRRYALATGKIQHELGWQPQVQLADGLRQTVAWYLENRAWWQHILAKGYVLKRQGKDKNKGNAND